MLANGREVLMIPGPTTVPDAVLSAMHRPAIDIRRGPLVDLTDTLLADLKTVFGTREAKTFIYAANGHGTWEAALSNVLSRGEKVLVLDCGRFARGWGEMASGLGLDVEILPGDWRRAADPEALQARLADDTAHEVKAVLTVQVDTASSVINDIPAMRKAIDAARHPALLLVDAIASLGTTPFEMDAWGVDLALTGSQKGLMTPPGLGVIAAGPRAFEAHASAGLRTRYWDWTARMGHEHYMKYCGTPPEHLLFGFRKAVDMLLEEGLEAVFRRHALLSGAVHAAIAHWARGGAVEFNVTEAAQRAPSVTTVLTPGLAPMDLITFCEETCGVTLGGTIGEIAGTGIRIGHMGHVNAPTVFGALGAIETGLGALGVSGASGGLTAAAGFLAEAVVREGAVETVVPARA
jgi:alanine-glyoxylate transaminase/serine-glyoxylate transaminase/serine-pyruvate transaminase